MAKERRSVGGEGEVPLLTTTLWNFPSQNYRGGAGGGKQGDQQFPGATPSYVIWNLLQRFTGPKDLVVDPMAGSGTTLDVARDLGRRALGYDLAPKRPDIFRVDARRLPLEDAKADFVFLDPPYSTHLKYSGLPQCIGELDARTSEAYFEAMDLVIGEIDRVLRPEGHMALYVSDSAAKGKRFVPIGFRLFHLLSRRFDPIDIVAVVRHNRTLKRQHWHEAAAGGNFLLRGFNYLFIMQKPGKLRPERSHRRPPSQRPAPPRHPKRRRP
jgi:SAM-dependent methyltransferase